MNQQKRFEIEAALVRLIDEAHLYYIGHPYEIHDMGQTGYIGRDEVVALIDWIWGSVREKEGVEYLPTLP